MTQKQSAVKQLRSAVRRHYVRTSSSLKLSKSVLKLLDSETDLYSEVLSTVSRMDNAVNMLEEALRHMDLALDLSENMADVPRGIRK